MAKIGDQMRQDLAAAGYAKKTQQVYWKAARAFVARFMKRPTFDPVSESASGRHTILFFIMAV